MAASSISPIAVTAKTPIELQKKMLAVQHAEGGKVQFISIYYANGEHVAWYLPLRGMGMVF